MAIVNEILGNNLIRHYSDNNKKLLQVETGVLYSETVDVLPCKYTYKESDKDIEVLKHD